MPIPLHQSFPEVVIQDRNILYHGTSNVAEEQIELEGLHPIQNEAQHALVHALTAIHRDVLKGRVGRNPGGFETLVFYSGELGAHAIRPVSLAFTHTRCGLYASADFCGGEVARTISRIHSYLHRLLDDPAAREERQSLIDHEIARLPLDIHPSYLDRRILDVEELDRRVSDIEQQMLDMMQLHASYQYGVIYAVSLQHSATPIRIRPEANGVYALDPIPVDALIGKVVVANTSHAALRDDDLDDLLERMDHWRCRLHV